MDELNGSVPEKLKILMIFIDRIGFPALAFLLMFGLAIYTLTKITPTLEKNTEALVGVQAVLKDFQVDLRRR